MKGTSALIERARPGRDERDTSSRGTAGVVGPRSGTPPARAVVGGLLVALAAIGAFVLAAPRSDRPTTDYVVAVRAVSPGERLQADDLKVTGVDLPPELAALAFTDPRGLVGTVALGPMAQGQLVQTSSIASSPPSPFEVSLSLEADRALDGKLVPGARVAVLATYGNGPDAETLTVASSAVVERVSRPTGLAVGTADVVTLGLSVELDADAVVHAARAGELTLVRTDTATAGASYQPPLASTSAFASTMSEP